MQDLLIEKLLYEGIIKACPGCTILTEKMSGCNFIACTLCKKEWCWICQKIKYRECNDKTHNSH